MYDHALVSMRSCGVSWLTTFHVAGIPALIQPSDGFYLLISARVVLGHTPVCLNSKTKAYIYIYIFFFPFPYSYYFHVRKDMHLPKHILEF